MAGLPEGFKNQMQELLGSEYDRFLEAMGKPVPVSVRYNLRKPTKPLGVPIPWCASGRYLSERPSFTLDPVFHGGGYYVQEASSMFLEQVILQVTDQNRPITALDLCGAPGGKSTHLLSLLHPDSFLFANEAIRSRTGLLTENLEKWGYSNVLITQNDPAEFQRLPCYFDLILVDAPCSGEGLFRKEPAAMMEWSPRQVEVCALRQRRILSDIWGSLKPGGVMIYSTCTYNRSENQDNLQWLRETTGCEFIPIRLDPSWGVRETDEGKGFGYQCLPHRVHGEGLFFAAMRKPGNESSSTLRIKDRLRYPSKAELSEVGHWLSPADGYAFFFHGPQVRALPYFHKPHLLAALENLSVVQAGTGVGEIKKNRIVPDHSLALSLARNRNVLSGLTVSREQALAYLRMDTLDFPDAEKGFQVVEYEGLGLGWVNVLPGRINNLFPSSRRIRLGN